MFRSKALVRISAVLSCIASSVTSARAAPCCAASAAAPAMISGDDIAQITASTSRSSVIGDATTGGSAVFRSDSHSETTQTYRLDGATLLSDRFQAGASLLFLDRGVDIGSNTASASGLGDVRADLAYEFLPEWSYSEWKPKGYVFLQQVFPTGKSKYESVKLDDADATGVGFYTTSLGTLLVKRWSSWDIFTIPEMHYSFSRSFSSGTEDGLRTVSPGLGGSLALGVGYSPGATPLRIGLGFQTSYQQPRGIRTASGESRTSQQLTWDTSIDATYLVSSDWSATATYSDQTLIGPSINSTLSRTFSLALQHRWER